MKYAAALQNETRAAPARPGGASTGNGQALAYMVKFPPARPRAAPYYI
jgi:hypothetical protein